MSDSAELKNLDMADFKLNDSNSVSVTCVYEQSTGEFSFEG